MAKDLRFILGRGEKLTATVDVPRGGGEKAHPYTLSQSIKALMPLFAKAVESVEELPPQACPGDRAVAAVTLHPAYLAKSYFPETLLRQANLTAIGSKAKEVVPRNVLAKEAEKARTKKKEPPPPGQCATQLFVAGKREDIAALPQRLTQAKDGTALAADIVKIEDFRIPSAWERVRLRPGEDEELLLEVVLHTTRSRKMQQLVFDGFEAFANTLELEPDFDRRFESDGLCFLSMRAPRERVVRVAEFAFLRVAREMPRLRQFRPFFPRNLPGMEAFPVKLPTAPPVSAEPLVAIFDGGLPKGHGLDQWVTGHDAPGVSSPVLEYQRHGMAVTSAVLFGPLEEDQALTSPPAKVDHFRVLDANTGKDPQGELYDVLHRIDDVLKSKSYPFVSLSIGPDYPVEDDDPSAWTTILDKHFGRGRTLAGVAVGNRGEEDRSTGYHRIQPPSDCVNALAVGAADSVGTKWKRAPYSCVGPGRCPGFVKPDVLAFGGSRKEPFWALDGQKRNHASPITGTSFAAPTAVRLGALTRVHFGDAISPLGSKALLVHGADAAGHDRAEVGWGRVPDDVLALMACGDGEVRVLYQDVLTPTRWLRAPVPLPEKLEGMVTITATLCFATETDPQDTLNYTRSGLEVVFRPHAGKRGKPGQVHADTRSFYGAKLFGETEQELRADSHKWETTLHNEIKMQSRSLKDPVFDIHYMAREEGRATSGAEKIPYALVISVKAPRIKDLFERTLARYPVLQQLRPVVEIPIRV